MIQKKALVVAVAIASSTLLFGCGGGSSSKSSGNGSGGAQISLTGMVAKGAISYATVTAIELDKNGKELGTVGTATTGADGRYELKLNANYKGGIVKLTVTPTANSKMVCDAFEGCGPVAFGQPLDLPQDFSLNAYVPPSRSGKVTAAVTPLTHMAAKRFEAGSKTEAGLKAAVNTVSQMAGFDILATEPVDISKTEDVKSAKADAQAYALFNSGLASLIFKEGSVETAVRNLEALAKSFEDGQFDSNDAVKITDITEAVSTAVSKASTQPALTGALTEAVGKINEAVAVIESGTDADGNFIPKVPDTSGKTELERGQAAIADLRTWINEIIDTHKKNGFENPAKNYQAELQTVKNTFDSNTQAAAQLAGYLVEQLAIYLKEGANVENLLATGSGTLTIKDENNRTLGTLNLGLTNPEGLTFSLNGKLVGDTGKTVTVSNLVLKTNLPASSLENGVVKQFSGNTAELSLSGSIESGATSLTLNSVKAQLETTEAVTFTDGQDPAIIEDRFKAAGFSGNVTVKNGGYRFDGLAGFNLVRLDRSKLGYQTEDVMSLSGISVSGLFTGPAETLEAGAKLSITNGTTFDTFGLLDWNKRMDLRIQVDGEVSPVKDFVAQKAAELGISDVLEYEIEHDRWGTWGWLRFNAGYQPIWGDSAVLDLNLYKDALAATTPAPIFEIEEVEYQYSAAEDKTWIEAEANVGEFESDDYFAQGTLTLSTKVSNIADLPNLNLTATVARDKVRGGTANLTLGWDDKLYRLEFRSEDVDPQNGEVATGTLVIRDNTGVVIALTSSNLDDNTKVTGTVTVDGKQIGTVDTKTGGMPIVRFTDGKETRFESLL